MKELLQFQSVKKMLGELKLLTRSENTERTYLKGIKRFVEYFKVKNLDDFLREVRKQGNGEEIYRDFVLYLASLELAPKTIASWSSAVKKLLKTNEIEIKRDVKIRVYNVHEDVLPSKEILRKIIENSNLRAKAIILFLLSSGLRVGELINLKIKDVNLSEFPPSIRVRGLTAKERKSRITFISKEASIFLKKYLEKRSKKEKLNEESFLFVTKDGKKMSYQNLHYIINRVVKIFSKKEGKRYQIHPHVFRKFFKTQLISAGVPGPIVDRLTGHGRYLAEEYELYTKDQLKKWYLKGMDALSLGISEE